MSHFLCIRSRLNVYAKTGLIFTVLTTQKNTSFSEIILHMNDQYHYQHQDLEIQQTCPFHSFYYPVFSEPNIYLLSDHSRNITSLELCNTGIASQSLYIFKSLNKAKLSVYSVPRKKKTETNCSFIIKHKPEFDKNAAGFNNCTKSWTRTNSSPLSNLICHLQ